MTKGDEGELLRIPLEPMNTGVLAEGTEEIDVIAIRTGEGNVKSRKSCPIVGCVILKQVVVAGILASGLEGFLLIVGWTRTCEQIGVFLKRTTFKAHPLWTVIWGLTAPNHQRTEGEDGKAHRLTLSRDEKSQVFF